MVCTYLLQSESRNPDTTRHEGVRFEDDDEAYTTPTVTSTFTMIRPNAGLTLLIEYFLKQMGRHRKNRNRTGNIPAIARWA